ncbi:MAG TPA: class I tRNA ligase family protein, partial [bacterium]|nr:class I tRNA ligase family protein [bacterium]
GIEAFVNLCKHRVLTYAAVQTQQSMRLGMWMDWNDPDDLRRLAEAVKADPGRPVDYPVRGGTIRQGAEQVVGRLGDPEIGGSYFTLSDENNYQIWGFLRRCHERGLIYKGHDVMPWCPRCATGLSEHEIATEGYKELTHRSVFLRFPLTDRPGQALLVWTTTPWTLSSNVAAAVHPELIYVRVRQGNEELYLEEGALGVLKGEYTVVERLPGAQLVGRRYHGPFDDLAPQQGVEHRVIPWTEVTSAEGTGIVHIAPGCGAEDFALSREHALPVIAPIDENGVFLPEFGLLAGLRSDETAQPIIDHLKQSGRLYKVEPYTHRYPVCWRCGSELVFRLVDEWFIRMEPVRAEMIEVTRRIRWIPEFGLDRELDWLRNMRDWMISKKRYWGLALPIYECASCGAFDVLGSREELRERALQGWEAFEGHSPHRPWIDAVKIRCARCGGTSTRIPDVGNPWLDAGIVSMSTLRYRTDRTYWRQWFPADFITESFPGQYRNWFYSLLVMGTVLAGQEPFRTCLGHASVRDERGREMHKSWGNAIEFNEAADRAGVDVMRWLYCMQNPQANLNFGYGALDEVRRRFVIPLWNVVAFFVTYANLERFQPTDLLRAPGRLGTLDRWLLSRLQRLITAVRERLDAYDPQGASRPIEAFVDDLSNWYVRRSRRRFWKSEADDDKRAAYYTLYRTLVTLSTLLAPFVPYLAERIYQDLVRPVGERTPVSVHLCNCPEPDEALLDERLETEMDAVRGLVVRGRAARGHAKLKVRQPLPAVLLVTKVHSLRKRPELLEILADELNVKAVRFVDDPGRYVSFEVKPRFDVLGPKYGAVVQEIARSLRKVDPGAALQTLERDGRLILAVDNQDVVLSRDDLETRMHEARGYAAEGSGGEFAILETELTPELLLEGQARELVHQVQGLRKEADLAVDDRIVLHYDGAIDPLVAAHRDYIMRETLAVELRAGLPAGAPVHDVRLDGVNIRLTIARRTA